MNESKRQERFGWSLGWFALALAVVLALMFGSVLFGGQTFFFRDYGIFGYPIAHYLRESVNAGEIPFWNPYSHLGVPFLAQWNTMCLYPGSLLYIKLPLTWGLAFFCVLHLWLGGVGMFCLARLLVRSNPAAALAGAAYVFNGLAMSFMKWPNNIAAFGLAPFVMAAAWVALTREGFKPLAVAVLTGTLQMMTGAPEVILLTWAGIVIITIPELKTREAWVAGAKRMGWLVGWVSAASAAQLLPFLDLLIHSQRDRHFGASEWAMPGWGLANFLVPLFNLQPSFHGVPAQPGQGWISTYYIPVTALCFAFLPSWKEARVRWLWIGVIVALVLALGDSALVYPLFRKFVPLLGFMRFPIKFVYLAILLLPLLIAIGADWAARDEQRNIFKRAALVAGVVAGLTGLILFLDSRHAQSMASLFPTAKAGVGLFLAPAIFAAMVAGWRRASAWSTVLVLSSVVTQCAFHSPNQNPTIDSATFAKLTQPIAAIGDGRVFIPTESEARMDRILPKTPAEDMQLSMDGLYANCNLPGKTRKVDGFFSLTYKDSSQIEYMLRSYQDSPMDGLKDFLGIRHQVVVGTNGSAGLAERAVREGIGAWFSSGQKPVFADRGTTIRGLVAPEFDPLKTVFLTPDAAQAVSGIQTNRLKHETYVPDVNVHNGFLGTAPFTSGIRGTEGCFAPYALAATVTAEGPTMLLVNQSWSPGWRATIDKEPVTIFKANHAFQAVVVPAGKHNVVFQYVERGFIAGCGLSLLTLGALIVLWGRSPDSAWIKPETKH